MRLLVGVALVTAAFGAAGCGSSEPPSYPVISAPQAAYVPSPGSPNAFDGYALAAQRVESEASRNKLDEAILTRVVFFPKQRKRAIVLAEPGLKLVRESASKPCEFKFTPRKPFDRAPYHQGWRLIGFSLQWRVKDACEKGDYDSAIGDIILATKFGFDLTGGDPGDASQGYWILSEARKALAPFLTKLGAAQLRTLSAGVKGALLGRPSLKVTLQHDHENMLAAIQYIQDCYQKGDFKQLLNEYRGDAKDMIGTLRGVKPKDPKRALYFQRLVDEANRQTARLTELSMVPQSGRPPRTSKLKHQPKGWRFNRHFISAGEILLELDDDAVARTRLLILEAELQRSCKLAKVAPHDLSQFTKSLTIDPYTGQPFLYRAVGQEYQIYSAGSDFTDNAGDTDETYTHPDLRLERSPS